jgi:outer membrane murein-binding lipoprotein Lpp
MSETLINSLNSRVSELTTQVAQLNAALKQERGEKKTLRTDLEKAQGQVTSLTTERDTWKQKAESAPGEQSQRITDLEGQLRQRDHRDGFREAALAAGVKPEAVGDLYQLLGVKPGDTAPKPEDFAEPLKAARTARAWAFGEAPAADGSTSATNANGNGNANANGNGTQGSVEVPATPPPPGAGRSASDTTSTRVQYRMSDVAKPGWAQANPALQKALAEGNAVCVGD